MQKKCKNRRSLLRDAQPRNLRRALSIGSLIIAMSWFDLKIILTLDRAQSYNENSGGLIRFTFQNILTEMNLYFQDIEHIEQVEHQVRPVNNS